MTYRYETYFDGRICCGWNGELGKMPRCSRCRSLPVSSMGTAAKPAAKAATAPVSTMRAAVKPAAKPEGVPPPPSLSELLEPLRADLRRDTPARSSGSVPLPPSLLEILSGKQPPPSYTPARSWGAVPPPADLGAAIREAREAEAALRKAARR